MPCGIYKITNLINGKCYIGSSLDINKRWNSHRSRLRKNNHHNRYLQNTWNKYGEAKFKFEIVEICLAKNLLDTEQRYLDQKPDYNIAKDALASRRGLKHSEKTKRQISKKRKGVKLSEETKRRMSVAKKDLVRTQEHQENLTNSLRGKKRSNKQRLKMKKAQSKRRKALIAVNKSTEKTIHFASFQEAKKAGFDSKSILRVIRGICTHHKGFVWSYVGEVS